MILKQEYLDNGPTACLGLVEFDPDTFVRMVMLYSVGVEGEIKEMRLKARRVGD